MKGAHLIIIGLLLVVIYLVWPSKKDHYSIPMSCSVAGSDKCPPGFMCAPAMMGDEPIKTMELPVQ